MTVLSDVHMFLGFELVHGGKATCQRAPRWLSCISIQKPPFHKIVRYVIKRLIFFFWQGEFCILYPELNEAHSCITTKSENRVVT